MNRRVFEICTPDQQGPLCGFQVLLRRYLGGGALHGGRAGLNKALSREKTHQILSLCFNLTPTLGPPQDHYMALGGTLQGLLEIKDTHRPRALQWGYA